MPSFGFGRYTSPGEGAAAGFTEGTNLGLNLLRTQEDIAARKQQREQHAQEFQLRQAEFGQRQKESELRQKKMEQEQEHLENQTAEAAMQKEAGMISGEMEGLYKQYNGDINQIPQDKWKPLQQRAQANAKQMQTIHEKMYRPIVEKNKQWAQQQISAIQSGKTDISQMDPQDLAKVFTYSTNRPVSDFLRPDDKTPSKVEQGLDSFHQGMQSGNQQQINQGMNVIAEPDLKVGVGQHASDGSIVQQKQWDNQIPHPNDPDQVMPVLKVTTNTGSYHAPLTDSRGTNLHAGENDHVDNIKSISMQSGLDQVGHLQVLSQLANTPGIKEKLQEGAQAAQPDTDSFLQAYYKIGGKPANLKKTVTRERTNLGGNTLEQTVGEGGQVLGERVLPHTAVPKVFNPNVGIGRSGRDLQTIQNYAEDNDISEEEAADALKRMGVIREPRSAGTGRPPSEASVKGAIQDAQRIVASDMGLRFNSLSKSWAQANGQPATPEQMQRLDAAESAVRQTIREQSGKPGVTPDFNRAVEAGKTAGKSAKPQPNFVAGRVYNIPALGGQATYKGGDPTLKSSWDKK